MSRFALTQLLAGILACGLLAATPAVAAGFLVRENSAEAVAMSYAGNGSRATGPDTVFANPAGMFRLSTDGIEGGAAVILPSTTFSGGATLGGVPIAGNAGGDSGRAALVPNLYGAMHPLPDISIGIAITAPFGNSNEYDTLWVGRYLGTKTAAMSADINPAMAWKIDDTWSVGAGFSAQYMRLDVTSAIDQAAIFSAAVPDALYRFKAHDWAFGFNVGVLADFGDTRLGLTYRSGIDHKIEGFLNFTGASPLLGLVSGPASAKARLPSTTTVSVTHQIDPDLGLSADIQYTHWSVFRDVTIQSANPPFANLEHYRDAWMVAVGASYKLDEDWSLKAGIAFDETPVTSRYRAVTLPDTDRYLLGVGAELRLSDSMTVEGAYGHSFALLHPNMNSSLNNTDPITHAVILNGKYDINVDILALSFRYAI
ncbi:MAG TPA: OmpP1/FadL family transporter [Rhizomicrobium sp.]|nr:OmpP1/FadL family transporter [Rhizomicrobium sp.]